MTDYSVINIGHPDIVPIHTIAEMISEELGADKNLINIQNLPDRMTLIKRPSLDRQRDILKIEPSVSLQSGVKMVCRSILERLAKENR